MPREAGAGAVGEDGFEQAEIFAAKAGEFGGFDGGDNGGHFAGGEERDGFHVAAVLVAEGGVGEQILDGAEAFGLEHGGAGGADAFDELERRGEVEGQGLRLFDGDALGQIARLIDVAAAADGDVIRQQLQRHDFEDGQQQLGGRAGWE